MPEREHGLDGGDSRSGDHDALSHVGSLAAQGRRDIRNGPSMTAGNYGGRSRGALPQAIVLIAGIPFNATLWFFGANELMGHLPIYGAMLALLVYGSEPRLRRAVSALLPITKESRWTLSSPVVASPA
jgi:hypothetical protein